MAREFRIVTHPLGFIVEARSGSSVWYHASSADATIEKARETRDRLLAEDDFVPQVVE